MQVQVDDRIVKLIMHKINEVFRTRFFTESLFDWTSRQELVQHQAYGLEVTVAVLKQGG